MLLLMVILGSAIWVLIDAKNIGVKKGLITGMGDMGPWGWFAVTLGLWIVGFQCISIRVVNLNLLLQVHLPMKELLLAAIQKENLTA